MGSIVWCLHVCQRAVTKSWKVCQRCPLNMLEQKDDNVYNKCIRFPAICDCSYVPALIVGDTVLIIVSDWSGLHTWHVGQKSRGCRLFSFLGLTGVIRVMMIIYFPAPLPPGGIIKSEGCKYITLTHDRNKYGKYNKPEHTEWYRRRESSVR